MQLNLKNTIDLGNDVTVKVIYYQFVSFHGITVTSQWAQWRLKSPASPLFIRAQIKKHRSSASLAFVRGTHRGPVNSPHKSPVTRKMFSFDDVIMGHCKVNSKQACYIKVATSVYNRVKFAQNVNTCYG